MAWGRKPEERGLGFRVLTTWVSHSGLAFHLSMGQTVPIGAGEASIPNGGWRGRVCKLGHLSVFLWAGHQALVCQVSEFEVEII